MKKPTSKRFWAYVIDTLIIVVISSLFAKIDLLNPTMDEYSKVYDEYVEYTKDVENVNLKSNELVEFNYKLSKTGIYISTINLVISILYFIVFQYFNKGQTIGMRLTKVRVVSEENKVPSFIQILIRALIINSLLVSIATLSCLALLSKGSYNSICQILQIIDLALVFTSVVLIIFREDGMGLHDMIAHTKVVFDQRETSSVKEANYTETKKTTKKGVK